MPIFEAKSVLKGIHVKEIMRRQVVRLRVDAPLDRCIQHMIKFKVNAVLVVDEKNLPLGIVSKTDLVSAFYAGLPLETAVENIMVGPLRFCFPDDALEASLDTMQQNRIHRLFVRGAQAQEVIGVLAFPDIVGLIYRYCRTCSRNLLKLSGRGPAEASLLQVKDVMTPGVASNRKSDSLQAVIETLTAHRVGAVLILDAGETPAGVVSKTDVILAFRRGLEITSEAGAVMTGPVLTCDAEDVLTDAIQRMIFQDVQRLFVAAGAASDMVGVLSLSDAVRFRSGSCRACTSSRLMA